ncbi:hypothetical protein [Granulicatella adiacens]|uniref:hypothetical protein n=1 Tax=Granulicatella adiacens TaxID=46124 RepID=UPI00241C44F2|nr:hypothetical protein [Granulicatella adiacens]
MERLSQHFQANKMNLEVRLMKRIYSVVVFGNEENDIMLVLKFTDQKFYSLSDFLNSEVHNFYPHIYKELEAVVTGQKEASGFGGNMLNINIGKEKTEVYYQMDDESLGEPCFISTDELYKLVIEWKEMEDKMFRGEDIFPLTIED